jgi:predicted Zn-dependent peptidase
VKLIHGPWLIGQADYVAELKQLAELCDTGVITEEEFEAKKQQLLGLQFGRDISPVSDF